MHGERSPRRSKQKDPTRSTPSANVAATGNARDDERTPVMPSPAECPIYPRCQLPFDLRNAVAFVDGPRVAVMDNGGNAVTFAHRGSCEREMVDAGYVRC